jgi:hypothetical protein
LKFCCFRYSSNNVILSRSFVRYLAVLLVLLLYRGHQQFSNIVLSLSVGKHSNFYVYFFSCCHFQTTKQLSTTGWVVCCCTLSSIEWELFEVHLREETNSTEIEPSSVWRSVHVHREFITVSAFSYSKVCPIEGFML